MISGKDHPELIPDLTAYHLYFMVVGELPNPSTKALARQKACLAKMTGMKEEDSQAIARIIGTYKLQWTAMVNDYNARVDAAVRIGSTLPDSAAFLQKRSQLVQQYVDMLRKTLSPSGMAQFEEHIQEQKALVLLSLVLTSGMTPMTSSEKPGGYLLVDPVPGVLLSLRQIEEHSHKLDDGTFAVEYTVTAQQYRDAAGRLRKESEIRDQAGNSSDPEVSITDPVAGVQTVLLSAKKVAYRLEVKLSPDARLFFTDAADGQDLPHKWKVVHTETEGRMIEGHWFNGSRIETSAEDVAGLTTTIDQWYSDKLKMIGAVDRKGPFKAYTVRIEQLQFGEPDSELFEVPSDYKVVNLPSLK
ncbi:MAG TPA: hypothetical protein VHT24_11505 [Pseudacidobacterium sp.]|jgi:hypothetical protein|nr:hypothetical protein [Pseudacidobacterium sp.]